MANGGRDPLRWGAVCAGRSHIPSQFRPKILLAFHSRISRFRRIRAGGPELPLDRPYLNNCPRGLLSLNVH